MAENQPGDILYYEAVQTEEGKRCWISTPGNWNIY